MFDTPTGTVVADGAGPERERPASAAPTLVDGFGRRITYLRLSVTDRCDLRCRYCMAETMTFAPRVELLTPDELVEVASAFIDRGVTKVRLTGGEPLVRRGIVEIASGIGRRLGRGLEELTLTTNGVLLDRHAAALRETGVRRVNVSLDTLDPDRFRHITRRGDLSAVLRGIAAASAAGLAVKINTVALAGLNEDAIEPLMRWCAAEGHDLTLIETMPLGEVGEARVDRYLPLDRVRAELARRFTLEPLATRTGGPARYWRVRELNLKLGLITPLTENFCAGCNRVRVTATGHLYLCLGHDDGVDLKDALRAGGRARLSALLDRAMAVKPRRHDFAIDPDAPSSAVARHMSKTGG